MRFLNGKWVYQAPAEDDGAVDSGSPAGEDASSDEGSEFEDMAESFESSSYDDEVEESTDDADVTDEAEDDSSHQDDGDDFGAEEETDVDSETDEDTATDDDAEESTEEEQPEDDAEEDEVEEKPEPMTAEQMAEARNQYIDQIAEQFTISDEEADQLRTEPEKVLPKMLARVQTQALEQAVQIMRNNLPQLVGSQLTQQTTAKDIEGKFFGKYPELKSSKAQKVATQMAKAYRDANPDAPIDEVMDNVAFMSWKKLGLPMDKLSTRMSGEAGDEEFASAGKPRKSKNTYTPANAGKTNSGNGKPARRQAVSEFEEIADSLLNDDMFETD